MRAQIFLIMKSTQFILNNNVFSLLRSCKHIYVYLCSNPIFRGIHDFKNIDTTRIVSKICST